MHFVNGSSAIRVARFPETEDGKNVDEQFRSDLCAYPSGSPLLELLF
jgi:hypothetical protein